MAQNTTTPTTDNTEADGNDNLADIEQKKNESNSQTKDSQTNKTADSFANIFEESFGAEKNIVGSVLTGKVVGIENEQAIIDVGLKTEGRVNLKEFIEDEQKNIPQVGDSVDVFVERLEDRNGEIQISREKVRREEAWQKLEVFFQNEESVFGTIDETVKGGFTVNLGGAEAFLPGSLVDIRPNKDHSELLNKKHEFQILKMDRARNNIVVSRRALMEKKRAGEREKIIETIQEGKTMDGIVKNITEYGAFIDLGGIDGLLHVTDMSWKRVNHPSDLVKVGESLKVKVIRYNPDTQRVSLGIKQMHSNPWDDVPEKYSLEAKVKGVITRVTDYGAFVELEPGVEGLVHISEMSWMRKNIHPSKIVSISEEVEVQVLELDKEKKRISLGMKSCQPNPWTTFSEKNKVGDVVEGTVKNTAEFGLFLTLPLEADGMVHITDLVWDGNPDEALKSYNRGDVVKVKILEINIKKERVALGIKQLEDDPFQNAVKSINKDEIITCSVVKVQENGILVNFKTDDGNQMESFIRRADLARNRSEQRPDRFAPGEKVDAQVIAIDKKQRKINLSIKAREVAEGEVVKSTFGSSDAGAVLGDILGKAIEEKHALEKADATGATKNSKKTDKKNNNSKETVVVESKATSESEDTNSESEATSEKDDGSEETSENESANSENEESEEQQSDDSEEQQN